MNSDARVGQPHYWWLRLVVFLSLLVMLVPLHDIPSFDAPAQYDVARSDFLSGWLQRSQDESENGYVRSLASAEEWSGRFLLLEAQSMLYRGHYADMIALLTNKQDLQSNMNASIEKLTLETIAFGRLHQREASEKKLAEAEALCSGNMYGACGGVMQARGLLAFERGAFDEAQRAFRMSLSFAQSHQDQGLQSTSLLNLGTCALQQDHLDEALSYSEEALVAARKSGAKNTAQNTLGNIGWISFKLGDAEKALGLLEEAKDQAKQLGNTRAEIKWLTDEGNIYQAVGDLHRSVQAYRETLLLAKKIGSKTEVVNSLELLAHLSAEMNAPAESMQYIREVEPLVEAGGNRLDVLDVMLAQAEVAAAQRQDEKAKSLLRTVKDDPASQSSMRMGAGHELAKIYEVEGHIPDADRAYRETITEFLTAQDTLKQEESKMPFMANAVPVYDDFIHFLVSQKKLEDALAVADQIRARTLEQGLGLSAKEGQGTLPLNPASIARKTGASLLFYWLGEEQSYLWVITPEKTSLYPLPPRREISDRIERYRRVLLGPKDPLDATDDEGRALYHLLIAPAKNLIHTGSHVVVLADGALSKLNFETLIVPGESEGAPSHYWIEDATLESAPSLLMLKESQSVRVDNRRLLLLGDAISSQPEYPDLPMSAIEMKEIEKHFDASKQTVLSRAQATTSAYFKSSPEQYGYIHFVTHAIASDVDPLDSAILLSRDHLSENGSFKLYARQILQHRIHANLVTISACYGSGKRSYAGEGLVGLSWAFLRAGAHNVIGALWEVDDASTPELMDNLYQGLEKGLSSQDALHQAKLKLLHSDHEVRKPYYWAPFQLYSGL